MSGPPAAQQLLGSLTLLDIALLLVLLYSTVRGFLMGAISEFGLLFALVIGVVVASKYAATVGTPLAALGLEPRLRPVGGYIIVLAVIWIVVRAITRVLRSGARLLLLGWLDRLGGAAFGLLRGVLIIVVAGFLIVHFRIKPLQADAHASPLIQAVSSVFPALNRLLPAHLHLGPLTP